MSAEHPIDEIISLDLARPGDYQPGLTRNGGLGLAEAGAVCLQERGHVSGSCRLATQGEFVASYRLCWPEIDDRTVRHWNDEDEATENGAAGIAILLIFELTEYHILRRSRKGTGAVRSRKW